MHRGGGALITLRRATVGDAAELAALARTLFAQTFAAQNDPADLAAYLTEAFGEAQQQAELADPGVAVWFADVEGQRAGYVQCVHGGDTPSCIPVPAGASAMELQRIYVDRAWHGQGVAPQLMAQALMHAQSLGASVLWLGVWEQNPRAIRYYEREGFQACGTHVFQLGADAQTDRLMWRSVT